MNGDDPSFAEAEEPEAAKEGEEPTAHNKLRKAPEAFRTISEVADELHIPQHVLRFWETKFPQVKPLKRGGGRRYYRPDDITLLRRISDLLYIQGYTIKGVQRLLREGGGRLAEDIPHPPPEERASSAQEAEDISEPQLPMPGLSLRGTPAARRAAGPSRGGAGGGEAATQQALREENRKLRSLLKEVLAELEALRERLGTEF
jgi:DNA-binding transcriptional MerR regulator